MIQLPLLLVLLAPAVRAAAPSICDAPTTINGRTYDLSSLATTIQVPVKGESSHELLLSPCGVRQHAHVGKKCPEGSGACLVEKSTFKSVPLASFSRPLRTLSKQPSELVMLMPADELFDAQGVPMQVILKLKCDAAAKSPLEATLSNSLYIVTWPTPAACPVQGRDKGKGVASPESSAGRASSLLWSLFFLYTSRRMHVVLFRTLTAGAVYMVLGYVYRSVIVGASGFDAIPHGDILADVLLAGRDLAHNLKARFLDSAYFHTSDDVTSTSAGGYHHI